MALCRSAASVGAGAVSRGCGPLPESSRPGRRARQLFGRTLAPQSACGGDLRRTQSRHDSASSQAAGILWNEFSSGGVCGGRCIGVAERGQCAKLRHDRRALFLRLLRRARTGDSDSTHRICRGAWRAALLLRFRYSATRRGPLARESDRSAALRIFPSDDRPGGLFVGFSGASAANRWIFVDATLDRRLRPRAFEPLAARRTPF